MGDKGVEVIAVGRNMGKTIMDSALGRELPLLPPEEADAEIRRLTLQVGELEEKNGALERRNAALEAVIKIMCRSCALRLAGSCDWVCPGRDYADTKSLRIVDLTTQQEVLCGKA